jgi:predicted short-subunit dehydrogenase-like oxidoreductase (DUF2520 family)
MEGLRRRLSVAVIGAGRVGTVLGILLERAGHRVVAATGGQSSAERVRKYLTFARLVPQEEGQVAARASKLVLLTVPDDQIAPVCARLAERGAFAPGQWVLHCSGSVGLDALDPAMAAGSTVLSLHPLQSFPDVEEGTRRMPGSPIAVTAETDEAFEFGSSLVADLGGQPFRLADDVKPLYHAAAVFASNYVVAVLGMAEHLFRLAGLEHPLELFAPLTRTAVEASLTSGPMEALTGPAARGDAGTIARNLAALSKHAPEAVLAYVELAEVAAGLAAQAGRLSGPRLAEVRKVLDEWR